MEAAPAPQKKSFSKREKSRSKELDEAFPWSSTSDQCLQLLDSFRNLPECLEYKKEPDWDKYPGYKDYVSDPIVLDIVYRRVKKGKKINKVSTFVRKVRQVFVNALRYWIQNPPVRETSYTLLKEFNKRVFEGLKGSQAILQKDRLCEDKPMKTCRRALDTMLATASKVFLFAIDHESTKKEFPDFLEIMPEDKQPFGCLLDVVNRLNFEEYSNPPQFVADVLKVFDDWLHFFSLKGKSSSYKYVKEAKALKSSFLENMSSLLKSPKRSKNSDQVPASKASSSSSSSSSGSKKDVLSTSTQASLTKFLDRVGKVDSFNVFQAPVDWENNPTLADYPKVIDKPMDFSTIRSKVPTYSSVQEFVDDCNLVFSNCETYNTDPKSDIRVYCATTKAKVKKLEREYIQPLLAESSGSTPQLVVKIPNVEAAAALAETASNASATNKKKKKKKKSSLRIPETFPEAAVCAKVLNDIHKMKEADQFLKPVSAEVVPDYPKIISEPMDFGTMKQKLSAGKYESLEAFKRDAALIFSNCRTFNQQDIPGFPIITWCAQVEQKFESKLKAYLEEASSSPGPSKSPSNSSFPKAACKKIIGELRALPACRYFLKHPGHQDPRFYEIVDKPMDIKTVISNLKSYNTAEEFAEDVRLTFQNSLKYFEDKNTSFPAKKYAKELLDTFNREYKIHVVQAALKEEEAKTAKKEKPTTSLEDAVVTSAVDDSSSSKKKSKSSKKKDKDKRKESSKKDRDGSSKDGKEPGIAKIKLKVPSLKRERERSDDADTVLIKPSKKKSKKETKDILGKVTEAQQSALSVKSASPSAATDGDKPAPPPPPPPPSSPTLASSPPTKLPSTTETSDLPPAPIYMEDKNSSGKAYKPNSKKPPRQPPSRAQSSVSGTSGFEAPPLPKRDLAPFEESCSRAVKKLAKSDWGGKYFGRPVLESFPDLRDSYLAVIDKPMDLRTILTNLYAAEYNSAEEVNKDMILMFNNALKFNADDSTTTQHMRQQFNHLREYWDHLYAERPDGDKTLRTSRREERDKALADESLSLVSSGVNKVLRKMTGTRVKECGPFLNPVNTNFFKDYLTIIEKPMDLSTIRNNINDGVYNERGGVKAFMDDMRRIFDNCLKYNADIPENKAIRDAANKMRSLFEKEWGPVTVDALEKRNRHKIVEAQALKLRVEEKLLEKGLSTSDDSYKQVEQEVIDEQRRNKSSKKARSEGQGSDVEEYSEEEILDLSDDEDFAPRKAPLPKPHRPLPQPVVPLVRKQDDSKRNEQVAVKEYDTFVRQLPEVKELALERAKALQESEEGKTDAVPSTSNHGDKNAVSADVWSEPQAEMISEDKLKKILSQKIQLVPKTKKRRRMGTLQVQQPQAERPEEGEPMDIDKEDQHEGSVPIEVADAKLRTLEEWQKKVLERHLEEESRKKAETDVKRAKHRPGDRHDSIIIKCQLPGLIDTPAPQLSAAPRPNKGKQILTLPNANVPAGISCVVSQRLLEIAGVQLAFGTVFMTVSSQKDMDQDRHALHYTQHSGTMAQGGSEHDGQEKIRRKAINSRTLEGVGPFSRAPIAPSMRSASQVPVKVSFSIFPEPSQDDLTSFRKALRAILHVPSTNDSSGDLTLLSPAVMVARRFLERIPDYDAYSEEAAVNAARLETALDSWNLFEKDCLLLSPAELQHRASRQYMAIQYVGLPGKLSVHVDDTQVLAAQ